jgi:hypothetical protein
VDVTTRELRVTADPVVMTTLLVEVELWPALIPRWRSARVIAQRPGHTIIDVSVGRWPLVASTRLAVWRAPDEITIVVGRVPVARLRWTCRAEGDVCVVEQRGERLRVRPGGRVAAVLRAIDVTVVELARIAEGGELGGA